MLPDAMRPDKVKVIFYTPPGEKRLQVHLDPDRPDAWKNPIVNAYIKLVLSTGTDVVLVCGDKKKLRAQYQEAEL